MSQDNVTKLIQPGAFSDPLTDILRDGARTLLAQAVEAEVGAFIARHAELKTEDGYQCIVRHGHLPEREIMTGIGPVAVRQPRVRDRAMDGDDGSRIRFTPAIWADEHTRWQKRDLSARHYVYLQARLEDEKQCILVIIGATPEGKKELVGFTDGARESAHDWRELLLDMKRRGLSIAPKLAVADGGLGFWKALGEVWPRCQEQRCWVHKTANVLNKLPKSQQPKAKRALHEIWMAETKADAETAFDAFIETYALKYDKAAACLAKDRDPLLAFYDFPAEHWQHLRTTNPIESVFATVRHRTVRTKGCLSHRTALVMVFKLVMAASRTWRRLKGRNHLPKIIDGVKFADGVEVKEPARYAA